MRCILAATAMLISGAAHADCTYVGEVYDYMNSSAPMLHQEVIYDRDMRTFTVKDKYNSHLYNWASGGTGLPPFAIHEDGERSTGFLFVDLKGKVKDGEPDHLLIFGNNAYWPQCD